MTEAGQIVPVARAARCGWSGGVAVTPGIDCFTWSVLVRACLIEFNDVRNVFVCPDTVSEKTPKPATNAATSRAIFGE